MSPSPSHRDAKPKKETCREDRAPMIEEMTHIHHQKENRYAIPPTQTPAPSSPGHEEVGQVK
jgi:hypothetical protein